MNISAPVVAWSIAFACGLLIGLAAGNARLPQKAGLTVSHREDLAKIEIEKQKKLEIPVILASEESVESEKGVALASDLDTPEFWKSHHAETFIRAFAERKWANHGAQGVANGLEFLAKRNLAEAPFEVLHAMLEGCFMPELPASAETGRVISRLDPPAWQIAVELYLKLCRERTLAELRKVALELGGENKDFKSPDGMPPELEKLVGKVWIEKGGVGLDALIESEAKVPDEISTAVRMGLPMLAAIKPDRAKELLKTVASRSPQLAGQCFLRARLPLREMPEVYKALNRRSQEQFCTALTETFSKGHAAIRISGIWGNDSPPERETRQPSPMILSELLQIHPVTEFPEKAISGFLQSSICSPSEVARWLAPLGEEKAAKLMDSTGSPQLLFNPNEYLAARIPLGHLGKESRMVVEALLKMSRTDAARAESYLRQLPEPLQATCMQSIHSDMLADAALDDPNNFLSKLQEAPAEVKDGALKDVALVASLSGKVDALKIASGLPPAQATTFLSSLLSRIDGSNTAFSMDDFNAVAAHVMTQPFEPLYLGAITKFAKAFVERDPARAIDCLNWIPSGPQREQAIAPVVEAWADADPAAACDWADALPPGRERDLAVVNIVKTAPSELDITLRSIAAIGSDDLRLEALRTLAAAWLPANPARFEAVLASAKISDHDRAALRTP